MNNTKIEYLGIYFKYYKMTIRKFDFHVCFRYKLFLSFKTMHDVICVNFE